ncbi:DUF1569 domain-containing protein [Mucilaginibacter sp.]|uniref:DUF1569 domain-containing protein n=1 Tax=Mucilaginibacter sp. TaxID=1882438 RepID=UPI0025DD062F|nr:DUF1569 domain-containing protein [Mucilaginibacter sp.]
MKKKRSIINKQLWSSFIALSGYFFESITVKRVNGADFFTKIKYRALKARIEKLKEGTPGQWGTMRVEQMLHHVNLSMGSGQGFYDLPDESYFFSKTIIKWIVINLYNAQPKGLRLPLCMAISPESRFDFEDEKKQLLKILDAASNATLQSQWNPHCYFGTLTVNQWGKLCSMHLDYHLRQFSA